MPSDVDTAPNGSRRAQRARRRRIWQRSLILGAVGRAPRRRGRVRGRPGPLRDDVDGTDSRAAIAGPSARRVRHRARALLPVAAESRRPVAAVDRRRLARRIARHVARRAHRRERGRPARARRPRLERIAVPRVRELAEARRRGHVHLQPRGDRLRRRRQRRQDLAGRRRARRGLAHPVRGARRGDARRSSPATAARVLGRRARDGGFRVLGARESSERGLQGRRGQASGSRVRRRVRGVLDARRGLRADAPGAGRQDQPRAWRRRHPLHA